MGIDTNGEIGRGIVIRDAPDGGYPPELLQALQERASSLADDEGVILSGKSLRELVGGLIAAREVLGMGVEALQAELPEGWVAMIGFTSECRFCSGWWATASRRLTGPPHYPDVVSSETDRPRGEHHDSTVAEAIRALRGRLTARGVLGG